MRSSVARFAKQTSERYLTPGNPTGITGVATHPAPRPALINLYNRTLVALQVFPKESAYRTSVEALTKHRLNIVAAVKPEGHDAWLERVTKAHPEEVRKVLDQGHAFAVEPLKRLEFDDRLVEWDATGLSEGTFEGPAQPGERKQLISREDRETTREKVVEIEPEPQLTAEQVREVEEKIGSGLIEEVVQVAKDELDLVKVMSENKVWEELVEKIPEGQWEYFERGGRHTAGTQAP